MITVADPHRPGDELRYHPGEANLRLADVVVMNKIDTADRPRPSSACAGRRAPVNPDATSSWRASPVTVDDPVADPRQARAGDRGRPDADARRDEVRRRHVAARAARRRARSSTRARSRSARSRPTFDKYPEIGPLLPAMGYSPEQMADLEETINASGADVVVIGTPIDLRRVVDLEDPGHPGPL